MKNGLELELMRSTEGRCTNTTWAQARTGSNGRRVPGIVSSPSALQLNEGLS